MERRMDFRPVGIFDSGMGGLTSVRELCAICQVPTLEEYGVDRKTFFDQIPKMSADAVASGSPGNTVRTVTEADCARIYRGLWH